MSESISKTILAVTTGLIVSLVGGFVGYLYRESFDAARLHVQYARVEAPEEPIVLSDNVLRLLKIDGNVLEFVNERVTWDIRTAVQKNEFTYQQVGEVRELLPKVLDRFKGLQAEHKAILDALQKALSRAVELRTAEATRSLPKPQISALLVREFPQISRRLAAARNYYRSVWKIDIFEEFNADAVKALERLTTDLQGDLTQVEETVNTVSSISSEFEDKWKAGEPRKRPIVGTTVPEAKLTVVVSNTGRTAALLQNRAQLKIGDSTIELVRFDQKAERRRRTFSFDKAPAGEAIELQYVFDTEKNPPGVEQKVYSEIIKDFKSLDVTVFDVGGSPFARTISR
jgi:hypothetical protein